MQNNSANYHKLGFLCLDSTKTFEIKMDSFGKAADIIDSFADSLYPLLESYFSVQLRNIIHISEKDTSDEHQNSHEQVLQY